jgi:hypothetical protein
MPSRPKALLTLWHIAPTGSSVVFAAMRFVASLKAALYWLSYSTLVCLDLSLYSLACFDEEHVCFDNCYGLIMLADEESVVDIGAGDILVALEQSAVILIPISSFLSSCQDLLIWKSL